MSDDDLKRAEILFEQKRYEQALEAYQSYLVEHPEDSHSLCMAARCFLHMEFYGRASEYASAAISVSPDYSYAHYVQAYIYFARNLDEEAFQSLDRALELEPTNPDYHVLRAKLYAHQSDWLAVKDSMEAILEHHPHHPEAQTTLAGALVRLRRNDEAEAYLKSVLENDSENEGALVELGNLHLFQSQWQEALDIFQSALAVNPENEGARSGMMTALRAKNPVYGLILRYLLWLSRFSKKNQNAIVYGSSMLAKLLNLLKQQYPKLAPVIGFILVLWRIFSYLTWTIKAGTTLLLRCNEYGRSLVNEEEVMESNIVGVLWFAALCCWLYHSLVDPFTLFCKIGIPIFLSLPLIVGGCFHTVSYGWPKIVARIILVVMTVSSVVGLFLFVWGFPLGLALLKFYFQAFPIVLLILSLLDSVEPEKE